MAMEIAKATQIQSGEMTNGHPMLEASIKGMDLPNIRFVHGGMNLHVV